MNYLCVVVGALGIITLMSTFIVEDEVQGYLRFIAGWVIMNHSRLMHIQYLLEDKKE